MERRHQCGVNGQLDASKQEQSISHDFQTTAVWLRWAHQVHVGCDSGTTFTLSPPETDPQILERWGYADEVHLGKYIRAKDFGLDFWCDMQ